MTTDHAEVQALEECGAIVEGTRVTVCGETVRFTRKNSGDLGRDGYAIRRGTPTVITASTRVAKLSAILSLQDMQASEQMQLTRKLKFNHRNYKHEITPAPQGEHSIERYTEQFWAGLCRELVRRHFNGVVFYIQYDPILWFADFGKYEEIAGLNKRTRERYRKLFNMILRVSKRYGLQTLVQQYMTQYPRKLALKEGIPLYASASADHNTGDFKHPSIWKYFKYMYPRFFAGCPDLDGLLVNVEPAPISSEFMNEVLVPTLGTLKRPPDLFFRLWYQTNPRKLCDTIERYPGWSMVGHKVMDTMDAYCYPAVDSRVRDWKEIFAKRKLKVDWNFLIGPCHNCGSNLRNRMWSDPEFVHTVLEKAEKYGANGFNFHTCTELLANEFDSYAVVDQPERDMAALNQLHLESAIDQVRGKRFDERFVTSEYSRTLGLDRRDSRIAGRALRDTSRAEIMHLQQFPLTTREGYACDANRQLSQHPLFHMPVNELLNGQHKEDTHQMWSYLSKTIKDASYPNDMQTIIDYVDPSRPLTKRNPAALAREMEKLGTQAMDEGMKLAGKLPASFHRELFSNANLAAACAHDIRAGINLFRLYFAKTRKQALSGARQSLSELKAIQKISRKHGVPYVHMKEPYDPTPDIAAMRKLIRHLEQPYPFKAFQAYASSRKIYNEIRRFIRPWRKWSDKNLKKALNHLKAARKEAARALELCDSRRARNVRRWIAFLDHEIACHEQPVFLCGKSLSSYQPLVHDNCFGYGGFAWEDFLGFFQPIPYDKGLQLDCSVSADKKHLLVNVRESGVDMKERKAHWKKFAGAGDLSGFVRILLDTDGDGRRTGAWHIFPRGEHVTYRELQCEGRQDCDMLASRLAKGCRVDYSETRDGWELTARISFSAIGVVPLTGDIWKMNIAANTPIKRNHAVSWCKGYEVGPGNPSRMGLLRF